MQFGDEGGDTVGLLYFETLQTGETERDIHQAAGHDKGLCKVGNVYHIFFETGNGGACESQPYASLRIFGMHTEPGENLRTAAVTLITVWEQPRQLYRFLFITLQRFFILHSSFFISPQRQYLVPVRCGAPITLYGKRNILVAARMDSNGVFGAPLGISSKVVYQLEGEVDIGA